MPNGRPMQARSLAIKAELENKEAGDRVVFDLQPDEQEHFSRFTQRARTVAKNLAMKVSVKTDRTDRTKGIIEVRETGVVADAPKAKATRRGRPRKAEAAKKAEAPKKADETKADDAKPKSAPKDADEGKSPAGEEPTSETVAEGAEAEAKPAQRRGRPRKAEAADAAPAPVETVETVEEVVVEAPSAAEAVAEAALEQMIEEAETPSVAVCVTGSVSAYKAAEIVRGLQKGGCDVAVAMTPAAERFVGQSTFAALTDLPVAIDLFDWSVSQLPHIDLADWADLIVVAPASADSIAKIAHGFADDCVCATVLAATSKVMVCPAMNVHMWKNAATQANVKTLRDRGIMVMEPTEGYLVCGDWGEGKLAPVDGIVRACLDELKRDGDHRANA